MFSISTTPAKQSVGETITILSDRLSSATLLEDRRAAILGLRSFAKDYPASVASGTLRSLIGSLSKDGQDVDTVKIVLEALLMLFSPNESSPEASDEIALWLADEFTQRQENITLLLGLLDSHDFHGRLYSLQLLSAILSARTERTEECIFTAPLGIPRLVSILDDQRDAIRNEAISLLSFLTLTSIDIQKLVAFENSFEKIFTILDTDGGLAEGGRAVEDSLILLANLLRRNTSNQSLFRETGCISRLTDLISQLLRYQTQEIEPVAEWSLAQRNRNVYACLAVIRLFLMAGSVETSQNQDAFWKYGLSYKVLELAFSREADSQIKAEALKTSGDMMRSNPSLQQSFASQLVTCPLGLKHMGRQEIDDRDKIYVIDGLLDLVFIQQDLKAFDVRFAACECLKAYFSDHAEIRAHFLARAIIGYKAGRDEVTNILTVLLNPWAVLSPSDPYRLWFAAVIAFHLLYDNPAAKAKLSELTEGDEFDGEEVVTSIQTITAHLISGMKRDDDTRILTGYLMLLLGWMFEDPDAVNDFLSEGSNIQGLIQATLQPGPSEGDLIKGLCAMLIGTIYEFSTKDSPIPRATLHSILTSRLDRDRYLDHLNKLRSHPTIREFEVIYQDPRALKVGHSDVIFDARFVEFLKDNYSRIFRGIDRDPAMEISIISDGVQRGISRELVDALRDEVEDKNRSLEQLKVTTASLEMNLSQEQAEHLRSKEVLSLEMLKSKTVLEKQQKYHEAKLRQHEDQFKTREIDFERQISNWKLLVTTKESEYQRQLAQIRKATEVEAERQELLWQEQNASKAVEYQKQLDQAKGIMETETERLRRQRSAEAANLKAEIGRLQAELAEASKTKAEEWQVMHEQHVALLEERGQRIEMAEKKVEVMKKEFEIMEAKLGVVEEEHTIATEKFHQAEEKARQAEEQWKLAQKSCSSLTHELQQARTLSTKQIAEITRKAEEVIAEATKTKEATQLELDDLLMVFGDVEDKVAKYKNRLRELGEPVSEGEDEDEDEGDEN